MYVTTDSEKSLNGLIYADQAIIVMNKPAGLLSVPGRGEDKQDCLSRRVQMVYEDALIVHRLDMATSGLILMGRGKQNQSLLSQLFEQRQVQKMYLAWVAGLPKQDEGSVELPLMTDWPNRPRQKVDHEQGRYALTHYCVLKRLPELNKTLLAVEPYTGRSHQIRVHLNAIGLPILGDMLYAPVEHTNNIPRLMLHAWKLAFKHPVTGEDMSFEVKPNFSLEYFDFAV